MTRPRDKDEAGRLQYETEHTRPVGRRPSVLGYLVILALVAFFLLLMAFFMQKRTDQLEDSIEKSSFSAVQSIENLIAERDKLKDQVRDLETKVTGLEGQVQGLEQAVSDADREMISVRQESDRYLSEADALSRLNELRILYNRGRSRDARALLGEPEERAELRASLARVSERLTADQRAVYDPVSAYDSITGWLGIRD